MIDHALLMKHGEKAPGDFTIQRALEAVRSHLGMDVAYLSEFEGNESVFRFVDAPGLDDLIKPGDRRSLDDVYCRHILAGRLPELIPDTSEEPLAYALPMTRELPIGSHVSIPVRLPDGRPYGMFCCLSARPNKSLNERDLQVMRVFAELATHQLYRDIEATSAREEKRNRIAQVISTESFAIVYQPICDLHTMHPAGFEALCRFQSDPYRSPDQWFREAAEVGYGIDLERAVLKRALTALDGISRSVYVSFNASPEVIVSGRVDVIRELSQDMRRRVVLEVTEHAKVDDYGELRQALDRLRSLDLRVAIDDAGAGFASLQHIVQLSPDIIKLDLGLTRGVDHDPARRALASALIHFARETGAEVVAEGIETMTELDTLKALGISKGQGYFLGRPMPIEQAVALSITA